MGGGGGGGGAPWPPQVQSSGEAGPSPLARLLLGAAPAQCGPRGGPGSPPAATRTTSGNGAGPREIPRGLSAASKLKLRFTFNSPLCKGRWAPPGALPVLCDSAPAQAAAPPYVSSCRRPGATVGPGLGRARPHVPPTLGQPESELLLLAAALSTSPMTAMGFLRPTSRASSGRHSGQKQRFTPAGLGLGPKRVQRVTFCAPGIRPSVKRVIEPGKPTGNL